LAVGGAESEAKVGLNGYGIVIRTKLGAVATVFMYIYYIYFVFNINIIIKIKIKIKKNKKAKKSWGCGRAGFVQACLFAMMFGYRSLTFGYCYHQLIASGVTMSIDLLYGFIVGLGLSAAFEIEPEGDYAGYAFLVSLAKCSCAMNLAETVCFV